MGIEGQGKGEGRYEGYVDALTHFSVRGISKGRERERRGEVQGRGRRERWRGRRER